jgi:hypothetical protein
VRRGQRFGLVVPLGGIVGELCCIRTAVFTVPTGVKMRPSLCRMGQIGGEANRANLSAETGVGSIGDFPVGQ